MSTAAARMRLLRQRARDHRGVVQVEIELEPVGAYLIDRELLRLEQAEDRAAIGNGVAELLKRLIDANQNGA
jgi:hypothetical protein